MRLQLREFQRNPGPILSILGTLTMNTTPKVISEMSILQGSSTPPTLSNMVVAVAVAMVVLPIHFTQEAYKIGEQDVPTTTMTIGAVINERRHPPYDGKLLLLQWEFLFHLHHGLKGMIHIARIRTFNPNPIPQGLLLVLYPNLLLFLRHPCHHHHLFQRRVHSTSKISYPHHLLFQRNSPHDHSEKNPPSPPIENVSTQLNRYKRKILRQTTQG